MKQDILYEILIRQRAKKAYKFMEDVKGKRLLDIGCGDGFLIRRLVKNIETRGIDEIYGTGFKDKLDYPDNHFDYVTMLAVIEHINNYEGVIKESRRVLKDGGLFIITTPRIESQRIIRFIAPSEEHEHVKYFKKSDFENIDGFDLTHYSTFQLGLNQLIVLNKKNNGRN